MDVQTLQSIKGLIERLSAEQEEQLRRLGEAFEEENKRVNLISRKDIDFFYLRHALHSLSVGLFFSFAKEQRILDIGTGGGFPGIPLAILFPSSHFTLVDSIEKKTAAVERIAKKIRLTNVRVICERVEKLRHQVYDTITCRAVAPAPTIVGWAKPLLDANSSYKSKGLLLLKGGAIEEEISRSPVKFRTLRIEDKLKDIDYYKEKYILYAAAV